MDARKLLLVGNPGDGHVGAHLLVAARQLGQPAEFLDVTKAYQASYVRQKWNWWLRGHRPAHLDQFGQNLLDLCRRVHPGRLLVVGIAPPAAQVLRAVKAEGVVCSNYLTDDPWNRQHHAPWFLEALPEYDQVFSPRQANLSEIKTHCPRSVVSYLPFAYDPGSHFAVSPEPTEMAALTSDILFAGGADPDRLPWIHDLIAAGWNVGLYGGYWQRDPVTRRYARGIVKLDQLRRAVACAKICLCLVRRANRDGHAMRTFELPAMGACLLVEHTPEHEAIFGPEGKLVLYFRSRQELSSQTRLLLEDAQLRQTLAQNCARSIREGAHTYADRLQAMLQWKGKAA
jgi:spore maturation protein CgeB